LEVERIGRVADPIATVPIDSRSAGSEVVREGSPLASASATGSGTMTAWMMSCATLSVIEVGTSILTLIWASALASQAGNLGGERVLCRDAPANPFDGDIDRTDARDLGCQPVAHCGRCFGIEDRCGGP